MPLAIAAIENNISSELAELPRGLAELYEEKAANLGAIKRLIGRMKRHGGLTIEAAKEIKQGPIDGDLEQFLAETREERDLLQRHLSALEVSDFNLKTPLKPREKWSTTK